MASPHDEIPRGPEVVTEVLPSHPLDRRRIDSDVRALLRQPSTPWITYNRASRASNLAAGDVLPRRTSVIDASAVAATPPAPAPAPVPAVEPSGIAVASDVVGHSVVTTAPVVTDGHVERPAKRSAWSALNIAVVAAGLTLSAGLVVATSVYESPAVRSTATRPAAPPSVAAAKSEAPRLEDAPPPDLAAGLGNTSLGHGAASDSASAASAANVKGKDPSKDGKFGRLTIRGAAKGKSVYLDGKRLLGTGVRSFTVQCGAHTVSTAGRNEGRDVDVPCNGELVVDR